MNRDRVEDDTDLEGGPSPDSSATTTPSLPDVEGMRRWLLSPAVLGRDGAVLSWSNPMHPGYPYPEAAGLLLSALCTAPSLDDRSGSAADRTAQWLCRSIGAEGGVGRGDTIYLFDAAVALAGLIRHRTARGTVASDAAIHRLQGFVCEQIVAGVAVLPRQSASDGRWSTQFGSHLLKCLHGLHLYARTFGGRVSDDIVTALINQSGRQPSPVYVHPFCYEQEGSLVIADYGLGSLFEPIEGALEWLAELQQPNGAIVAFANGMDGFGEPRSDATAQAVRLWLLRDRRRYHAPILRALAFLAACQTTDGGIRYTPERDDVCSWSTLFTLQAVQWFTGEPRLDDLL